MSKKNEPGLVTSGWAMDGQQDDELEALVNDFYVETHNGKTYVDISNGDIDANSAKQLTAKLKSREALAYERGMLAGRIDEVAQNWLILKADCPMCQANMKARNKRVEQLSNEQGAASKKGEIERIL